MSKKQFLINFAILIFLFVIALATYTIASSKDGLLKIYFLDVGQGDAVFIKTPLNNQILIDGGPDRKVIQELSKVMPFYDRSIDMLILSHPDADHLNGLIEVLKRYKIGKIIETGVGCDTANCRKWEEEKEERRIENYYAYLGTKIYSKDGVVIEVLYPFEEIKGVKISKRNNSSLVLKLSYGGHSVLLTGDIEKQVEDKLVLGGLDINSDFLKVAHHGSKTSTTEEFLRTVMPTAAFIQAGFNNRHGHPTEEVLGRLEDFDILYYRTDINGRIELVLGKDSYYVKNEK